MTDRDETLSTAKGMVTLLAYSLTGAAVAVLGIFLADGFGQASEPMGATDASARACPLSASPEACDACMLAFCLAPCRACADNPSCLRLFSCMADCTDEPCETACAAAYPEGRDDLSAFLGVDGCLARHCTDACP